MSQAIKCDRCGKLENKTPERPEVARYTFGARESSYDLCVSCDDSFGQWVNNKPEPAVATDTLCKCEKPVIRIFGEGAYCGRCGSGIDRLAIVHGVNCPKVEHEYGMIDSWQHGNTDDGPYEYGLNTYCGRCHQLLGPTGAGK